MNDIQSFKNTVFLCLISLFFTASAYGAPAGGAVASWDIETPTSVKTVVVSDIALSAEQIRQINDNARGTEPFIDTVKANEPKPITADLSEWTK